MSLLDGFLSLGSDVNKTKRTDDPDNQEGALEPLLPELELKMTDEELIALKKEWEKRWEPYRKEVEKKWDENEKYWLGKQFPGQMPEDRPLVDNVIFESLETFLPMATSKPPEPMVDADASDQGRAVSDKVQKMLVYLADHLRMKLTLKRVARYWALYLQGAAKVGWDLVKNDITMSAIRPQRLILDPDATIDENMEYTGHYIGETLEESANVLVKRFPKKKKFITGEVDSKLGSRIGYTQWWTDEYVFWTLKNEVLGKNKNPHWNYETQQPQVDPMTQQPAIGPDGQPAMQTIAGRNHFPAPKKPYIFLSIFNLGLHPHDDVSLIGQNLAMQDLVNKRLRQIDKNADNVNGGWAISGERSGLTKEEAAQAIDAFRKGGGIYITQGNVNEAVAKMQGEALPPNHYQSLQDYRQEILNVFGVRGSMPQGTMNEQTVRGKIMVKNQDSSRTSFITEYLEQFADQAFNWFVQLMYVYYDEPHYASVLGHDMAAEYVQLVSQELPRKLTVSVKEGSLIPKDELTEANQAIDLWSAGAIDPITLFSRLKFPNPRQSAETLFLWQANPIALFPELQQQQQAVMQQHQASGEAPPGGAPPMQGAPPGEAPPPPGQAPPIDLNQVPIQ